MDVGSLCQKDLLEESMATHSSILAWRIPWTEDLLSGYSLQGCKEAHMTEMTQYACANTHTAIRVAKSRMLQTPNATEDMEQQEFLSIPGGNTKWYSHFGKYFGSILQS